MEQRALSSMWWSGFFALATGVHLLRAILQVPLQVGATEVPLWLSWVVAVIAGALSVACARRAGVLPWCACPPAK